MKTYLDVGEACRPPKYGPEPAPRRVWLVDDSPPVREAILDMLDHEPGFRFEAVFDSAETMLTHLAIAGGPDVILTDVQMGGMSGLETLRPVRELAPQTAVVVMTTFFDAQWKREALANGAGGFIVKSAEPAEFARVLREAVPGPVTLAVPTSEVAVVDEVTQLRAALEAHSGWTWARVLLERIRGMGWERI